MVTFPRYLPDVPWALVTFDLERSVSSTMSGGRLANIVEYADPLWRITLETKPLRYSQRAMVEAWWDSLRGGLRPVVLQHPLAMAPAAHRRDREPAMQAGNLSLVESGNILSVTGVHAGLILSPGDLITFEQGGARGVGRVIEARGGGGTRIIEVEPIFPRHLSLGLTVRFDRAELIMRPVFSSFSKGDDPVLAPIGFQLMESRV